MQIVLAAVGRLKAGPERDLLARYIERARATGRAQGVTAVEVREIDESRARRDADRRAEEAGALRAKLPADAFLILLDERGTTVTSAAFAQTIAAARDAGASAIALAIGGPDGHDETLRAQARRVIAFGAMTWPHQIVRVLAAEQIYRAMTILSGHPYHRG